MEDISWFADDANDILRLELNSTSQLYEKLYNAGAYHVYVELDTDLDCLGVECNLDTIRVVKVGSYFYEYVQQPCVQHAFYNNGKWFFKLGYKMIVTKSICVYNLFIFRLKHYC